MRIKLIPEANDDPTPAYAVESGNPTFIEHEDGSLNFCLAKAIPQILLTVDDKGLQPVDGIYSGTISPPNNDLFLNFNIQWSKPDHSTNGKSWDLNTDNGIYISTDGSQWFADIRSKPPRSGSFTSVGTYALEIWAYGYEGGGIREYIVEPEWDIEYVLNGETIHDFVNGIVPPSYLQNTAITSLLLRDSVTDIGEFSFNGCTSLENLTLSNSLVSIGQYAFNGMFELTSLSLSEGLTVIGDRAFTAAKKITSLSIPSSVSSMGDQAFRDCFLLESITVLAVVPPVCTDPFYNTSGGVIPDLFSIYVPSESVTAYKAAAGWSNHSSRIFAII